MTPLWTAGAVLLGFQLAALAWRLNREIKIADENKSAACGKEEPIWLTRADYMTFTSVGVLVLGVFILPFFIRQMNASCIQFLFGLSLIIFASVPPVIAGHYDLYGKANRTYDHVTTQERWASRVAGVVILTYAVIGLYWLATGRA